MGLDQFAYKVKKGCITQPVDFDIPENIGHPIHLWRKHPNIHGWMEKLYHDKGGTECFNCDNVELTMEDMENLETDLKEHNLPHTSGFFFGTSTGDEIEDDLNFVKEAKNALKSGYQVYYTSWW